MKYNVKPISHILNVLLLLIFTAVVLFSCSPQGKEIPNTDLLDKEEAALDTAQVTEPISVSEIATEDFLQPFEKYSWEREYPPEYVMIHFISAVMIDRDDPYNIQTIREIFEDQEISINYIIERNGNVRCYIPEYRAAWHAGKGSYKGIEKLTDAMNRYSIGIEIVAMGSVNDMSVYMPSEDYYALDQSLMGFTDEQYESLRALVRDICDRNNIPFDREHVIGHQEYKPAKTDPGELFDWDRLMTE